MSKALYEQEWEKVQIECAAAWANLDIAVEMIEDNKKDLTLEQYAEIQKKIDEQQKMIQDTLLEGKVRYQEAVKKFGGKDDVQHSGAEQP